MSFKILVVDDDAEVRNVVRRTLESAGYAVREAANGAEAIAAAQATLFDLVITDILMPEKDGLETVIHLRRNMPDLSVIAISGCGNELYLRDAVGLGATKILAKPFTPTRLRELVAEILTPAETT